MNLKSFSMTNNIWIDEPEEHDFPAALDFLDLLFSRSLAEEMVARLKSSPTIMKKAKDRLRASELPLLPKDNIRVKNNLQKVKNGSSKLLTWIPKTQMHEQCHFSEAYGYVISLIWFD
jgi:hypothetical protein